MPLDNTIYRTTPDVLEYGFEGLRQLSTELKNQLPYNFRWSFGTTLKPEKCGSVGCALGLAVVLWPEQVEEPNTSVICAALGLGAYRGQLYNIFADFGSKGLYPMMENGLVAYNKVTPQMVAAQLDHFITAHEGG